MIRWLMLRRNRAQAVRQSVSRIYDGIVAQSRRIEFYRDLAVPDSLDGRFDMLVLHMVLVQRRLKGESRDAARFAQALFDHMFVDMDESLREIGVGDMSVGKRVKQMGAAFYGRLEAYEAGLAGHTLEDALARNVYRGAVPDHDTVRRLADYVRSAERLLATQPVSDVLAGTACFGDPSP